MSAVAARGTAPVRTGARRRGSRGVLRAAPLAEVVAGSALAAVLFGLATLTDRSAWVLALLALAVCGGAAAYALDDAAAPVADATPAARPRRAVWRLVLLGPPVLVGGVGLLALADAQPDSPWRLLAPVLVGLLAVGFAAAAALRRQGDATPGDRLAPSLAILAWLLLVAQPLHRWVPVVPYDPAGSSARSTALWVVVVGLAAVVALRVCRDPARR